MYITVSTILLGMQYVHTQTAIMMRSRGHKCPNGHDKHQKLHLLNAGRACDGQTQRRLYTHNTFRNDDTHATSDRRRKIGPQSSVPLTQYPPKIRSGKCSWQGDRGRDVHSVSMLQVALNGLECMKGHGSSGREREEDDQLQIGGNRVVTFEDQPRYPRLVAGTCLHESSTRLR